MILFKPAQVSLLNRPLEYRGRFGLSISALLHVPMAQPPQGNLWGEQSLWAFVGQAGMESVLDEAVVKMQPEYLVHGAVHAPPPGARTSCAHATSCVVRRSGVSQPPPSACTISTRSPATSAHSA